MKKIFFFVILGLGFCLTYLLATKSLEQEESSASFVPLFKIVGVVPQSLSRTVSKVLPINSFDEEEFGKHLNIMFSSANLSDIDAKREKYLNNIMNELEKYKKKPFLYHVHLLDSESPNAMALPGGIILVTNGLFTQIKSEGELVGIMAHEMGHIELSHCFDSVKYEMLSRKMSMNNMGALADFARNVLIKHSFSKNQEDEADEYGFKLLTLSKYDPASLAHSFISLNNTKLNKNQNALNPFRDYFLSHPPMLQRISKFTELAKTWWNENPSTTRYIGKRNLNELVDQSSKDFGAEERIASFGE